MFEQDEEYAAFEAKFKPKLTTDDCYTPPLVFDTVRDWACTQYGFSPDVIVRPFYPGGDYVNFEYPDGCVVLDNPPFSILTQICEFYLQRGIRFFLFAPALTIFSGRAVAHRVNHILVGRPIEYENGAKVNTGFVTNLAGDVVAQSAPDLSTALKRAMAAIRKEKTRTLPQYDYPAHVLTASRLNTFARRGIPYTVTSADCCVVNKLDAQAAVGKSIFGSGLLLSDSAAAAAAAADAAAADAAAENKVVWELSPREMKMVAELGKGAAQ